MTKDNIIKIQTYHSPCGDLLLGSLGNRLCLCNWVVERHPGRVDTRLQKLLQATYATEKSETTDEAARQLDEYFARRRQKFDIPLLLTSSLFCAII